MKRLIIMTAMVGMIASAAFGWQAKFGMTNRGMSTETGLACLAHCLLSGSDEIDVAVTIVAVVVILFGMIIRSIVLMIQPVMVPPHSLFLKDPRLRLITVRRE